jgi:hypothetical protein
MLDSKTGAMVDYLFVHRGRRIASDYLNRALIPILCAKAGVPLADARGRITSHPARATIASQLFNAKEPLTLIELQALAWARLARVDAALCCDHTDQAVGCCPARRIFPAQPAHSRSSG